MNIHYLINTSRILGLLLMPFSATMLPPICVALWYHENTVSDFILATTATLALGLLLWYPFRKQKRDIQSPYL
jgi:trk system potassium uptake protein